MLDAGERIRVEKWRRAIEELKFEKEEREPVSLTNDGIEKGAVNKEKGSFEVEDHRGHDKNLGSGNDHTVDFEVETPNAIELNGREYMEGVNDSVGESTSSSNVPPELGEGEVGCTYPTSFGVGDIVVRLHGQEKIRKRPQRETDEDINVFKRKNGHAIKNSDTNKHVRADGSINLKTVGKDKRKLNRRIWKTKLYQHREESRNRGSGKSDERNEPLRRKGNMKIVRGKEDVIKRLLRMANRNALASNRKLKNGRIRIETQYTEHDWRKANSRGSEKVVQRGKRPPSRRQESLNTQRQEWRCFHRWRIKSVGRNRPAVRTICPSQRKEVHSAEP